MKCSSRRFLLALHSCKNRRSYLTISVDEEEAATRYPWHIITLVRLSLTPTRRRKHCRIVVNVRLFYTNNSLDRRAFFVDTVEFVSSRWRQKPLRRLVNREKIGGRCHHPGTNHERTSTCRPAAPRACQLSLFVSGSGSGSAAEYTRRCLWARRTVCLRGGQSCHQSINASVKRVRSSME